MNWNTIPGQTGLTAINLKAGNHTVTIKDAMDSSIMLVVSINEPLPLVLEVNSSLITSFGGSANVSLFASGGTEPYTYSGPIRDLKAGSHSFTVKDANGCSVTKTIFISQPDPEPLKAFIAAYSDVSCTGKSDGTALVSVTGGLPPYTYSWIGSNGISGPYATNLYAGTYDIKVTDIRGVSVTASVKIVQPQPLVLTVSSGNIASFNGTTTIQLNASGGSAPYSFSGGPIINVPAGIYSYTVIDAKGCSASRTITVEQPPPPLPLELSINFTDILCHGGSNGTGSAIVKGGIQPYQYLWSNGATSATVSGLSPGNYTIAVTDADGKTVQGSLTVSEPSRLVLNVSRGQINQFGGTTEVQLSATGGIAPYSFRGPTSSLRAGTYMYMVMDSKGCEDSLSVVITEPAPIPPLRLTAESGDIKCYGGTTAVSLRISGGIPPYKIDGDTLDVRAGRHSYSVTDSAGNTITQVLEISEPEILQLSAISGLIRNIGGTTDIKLVASGGVAPYTYLGKASDMPAGVYNYFVVDANGCLTSADVEVKEPAVKLSAFDLAKGDTSIELKWSTSYEYAIDHFEIEKSSDYSRSTTVDRVKSLWNNLRMAKYVAQDSRPSLNWNYYKITAVTIYGEKIMLEQKDLYFDERTKIKIRNMTSQLGITVENSYMEDLQLVLSDIYGRSLIINTLHKKSILFTTMLDMQGLPPGTYVLAIHSRHFRYTRQVAKPQ
jgi:hypothetical protein